ncbi:hypothetical protein BGZ54_009129 [Gamsiella multidivaricata]|nr:hypothetical protein BGZ54_009129 [Gamsiella multidivaricata]
MSGLKHELDQWNEGVIAFDQGLYEDALEIFEPIAESAKIHFNIGVVLATLGDFEGASAAYEQATKLDHYLAIAYFQNGVANVALENYARALTCFHDAYLYLRGNMVIDYTQLGLDFKLYSCQVLFNRALCYIELGEMDLAMTDLWRASREKQTKAHDILDQALRDKGRDCTVFTVPQGVLYRPAESKVKNSKKKDYLGNSKVIAAVDASDQFAGFKGMSAWQVQMSGPTNVAAVEEPRSMTPPNGLQRRATERLGPGMNRRGADPERPPLEHSASFSGHERRGSNGSAGSDLSPRPSLLARRNTEAQRPSPLNTDANGRGGISSATAGGGKSAGTGSVGGSAGRSRFQDELDEIEQHVYALSVESDRNNGGSMRSAHGSLRRKPSQNSSRTSPPGSVLNGGGGPPVPPMPNMSNYNSNTSPPLSGSSGRSSPGFSDLRRAASNGRGLRRDNSFRVKCHYIDTRAVLVRPDTPLQELIQRVQEKFQSDRPLKLKYKDEDHHMLSMIDDEDWLMAQQVHIDTTGGLDRMELWCFDEE